MHKHIIFVTTSRGRGLEDSIEGERPFPESWTTQHILKPGGTISTLLTSVERAVSCMSTYEKDVYTVLSGGICDLTSKVRHAGGTELQYEGSVRA